MPSIWAEESALCYRKPAQVSLLDKEIESLTSQLWSEHINQYTTNLLTDGIYNLPADLIST